MTQSLRVRLPLVISGLIAVSLVTFLSVSFHQVRGELLRAGQARAQAASDQLGALLAQSAQQQVTEAQRAAQDPAIRRYLDRPFDAEAENEARQRLTALAAAGQPPIELWDDAGMRRLQGGLARSDRPVPQTPPIGRPSAEGVSAFQSAAQAVYWDIVAAVHAEGAGAAPRGFVVSRRNPFRGGNPDAIKKLVGAGTVIRLGSASGVWSDLSAVVAPPGTDVRPGPFESERAADGERFIGAATAVRGTPWLVLVEFPRRTVVAPAQSFLLRMLIVAAALVLAAAAAAYALSARITRPLAALTRGAEAIAEGRFGERIDIARRDEIGRLAVAFGAMATHVQAARADLETRVTERTRAVVELNTQLERRVAELKALGRELESFTYSVSHDLRAPLRHVAGFATLLQKRASRALDAEASRYVQTIVDAAARMGRLVDDLLGFSRMSRAEMQAKHVDLDEVIRDVVRETGQDTGGRRINWTTHPLPPVIGDPAMLRLAFANLVSNAIKYTAPREIAEIEIGAEPAANGERVVYVRDNGVGFDMAYVDKLFGVFQRLHAADQFEGTGIGLANVQRIIQRHGGRTWAEGAVDRGATFFVSLPEGGPTVH